MTTDTNTVISALYFVFALVGDALTAVEGSSERSVPASLRASSWVSVILLAAPAFVNKGLGIDGTTQSFVLCVCVLALSMLGLHEGGEQTRAADGIFVFAAGTVATIGMSQGGIDKNTLRLGKDAVQKKNRAAAAALAGSVLLYVNARILRTALTHAGTVRGFRLTSEEEVNGALFQTLGYAVGSLESTLSTSFGAAVGLSGAFILISKRSELERGVAQAGALTMILGMCGLTQFLAAFASHMAMSVQLQHMPALFGEGSCNGGYDICKSAYESRRLALANTPSPQLFVSSLGLLVIAFPHEKRLATREAWRAFQWSSEDLVFAGFGLLASIAILVQWCTFEGDMWYVDWVGLVTILGVFASVFWDTQLGTVAYIAAEGVRIGARIYTMSFAYVTTFVTNVATLLSLCLLALHFLLTVLTDVSGMFLQLDQLTGAVVVLGMSLSVALYLATAGLQFAANGGGMDAILRDTPARASLVSVLQHYVPVFMWGSLYACRCEVSSLDGWTRVGLWLLSAPLAVMVYAGCLTYSASTSPYGDAYGELAMGTAAVAAALPWIATSVL